MRHGCQAQCHGLVRLKAGNARTAGLCAVALCPTALLAIGGPPVGSGTLREPQNATTCSRGCPRRGADARGTCAVDSDSQETLVARRCSSAWSRTRARRSRWRPSEGRAGGARLPWMRGGAGRVAWSSRDATRWRGGASGGESVRRAPVSGRTGTGRTLGWSLAVTTRMSSGMGATYSLSAGSSAVPLFHASMILEESSAHE